jgi:acyl-CoA synthetase (NDP forming)/GNAT superfamily N-acetyltransferase
MFRIITDAKNFREYVLLRDGQSVLLRLATPADQPALEALMGRVSGQSLRMRFMGSISYVSSRFVAGLCGDDLRDRACLLAIMGDEPDFRVVGFGNYISLGVRNIAEVAFLVEDAYQGRGISTAILERLAGIGAGAGLVGFEAEVLFENQPMLRVFRDSGFEPKQALDGGSYHLEFPVAGAAAVRERGELRERIATANSVASLLRPKVVAVVGASRSRTSVGSLIFQHILKNNFSGTVYPVNNQAAAVHGVRAYPSVSELPEAPDLVVVAVPADRVLNVAEESVRAGAKGLIVVTSGFAETGPEGAARQERLLDLVRSMGARLVGPNCLGLLNTDAGVRLDASLAPTLPPLGRIGFFSHSAALGLVILQYAAERGLGFSSFVSAGNRADVSGNDLLQYWEEDSATDIAMLYLESFGNARRFARVARRISYRKPVLCVKSARSRAGRSAARAHIAAKAFSDVEVDVLFKQAGVTRVDTLEELFDVALLLAHQPLPPGNRVAILGNSGGVVTITADACEANGLGVASDASADLGPLAGPEHYRHGVEKAFGDPGVDAVIAIFLCVGECEPQLIARGIRRGVLTAESRGSAVKPVLLCLMGASGLIDLTTGDRPSGVGRQMVFPSYRFPEAAVRALSHAVEYAAYRRQPPGRLVWCEDVDPAGARQRLEEALAAVTMRSGRTWLEEGRAREILACFGIAVVQADGAQQRRSQFGRLTLRSHPDFGPLIRVGRGNRTGVERITPLTDQDIRGMLEEVGLPGTGSEAELLSRLSQMVEELPWLVELRGGLVPADGGAAALAPGVRLAFTKPA